MFTYEDYRGFLKDVCARSASYAAFRSAAWLGAPASARRAPNCPYLGSCARPASATDSFGLTYRGSFSQDTVVRSVPMALADPNPPIFELQFSGGGVEYSDGKCTDNWAEYSQGHGGPLQRIEVHMFIWKADGSIDDSRTLHVHGAARWRCWRGERNDATHHQHRRPHRTVLRNHSHEQWDVQAPLSDSHVLRPIQGLRPARSLEACGGKFANDSSGQAGASERPALRDEQALIGTLEVAHAYRTHHGLVVPSRDTEEPADGLVAQQLEPFLPNAHQICSTSR